jgi:hypothetical protein
MKKHPLLIALLLAAFVLTGYGQKAEPFTSTDGRFSFIPPTGYTAFVFEQRSRTTETGDLEIHQYSKNLARGSCMIAFYDLPESVFQSKTIQKLLEDGRDGGVKNVNGVLDKEVAITVDGYPGLSIYLQVKKGEQTFYIRSDFVVAKPRMYNYLYLSLDKAEFDKADIKEFFGSFHITK